MFNVLQAVMRGARRGVLSSKRGNKNYYKGKGSLSTGVHTRTGGYILDPYKVVNIYAPDLTGFDLKPYVTYKTAKKVESRLVTPDDYLSAAAATLGPSKPKEE